ncbi:MAG TPA: hypothetical protein VMM58_08900 [Bacteroidota bacterium]|nr:hypothetical protein [Bacteroidota bacterium]
MFTDQLKKIQTTAALLGAIGVAALIAGAVFSPEQFFHAYLFGYLAWLSVPLGCLGLLMLHHMVSGRWGHAIQRIIEAGALTLPLMAILFIPILIGLADIYPWVNGADEEAGNVWAAYLNVPFFSLRCVVYFGLWIGAAYLLSLWSTRQDETQDPRYTEKFRMLSAPGLVVFALTVTFAAVDWVMSLEPGWSSTIYGFIFIVGDVLAALSVSVLMLWLAREESPLSDVLTTKHFHYLGNLLLTCVILWAYMAYSQWIIIWAGNLPDENSWYLHRLSPGWNGLALGLIIFHFFVPFFLLLGRQLKQSLRFLTWIALGLFVMRFVDMFWIVMPAFHTSGFEITWMDVASPLAVGGIWVSVFIALLKKRALVPKYDPRFAPGAAAAEH